MANNGDSSIWRSLAVAFGDGVAFGFGMKMTQAPPRAGVAEAHPDPALTTRIEQLEQRLESLASAPPPPATALDQSVIEVIVKAIDARLREYSAQVERRLLDLDAKYAAKLQGVDAVHDEVFAEIETLRERLEEERAAILTRIADAIYGSLEHKVQTLAPPAA